MLLAGAVMALRLLVMDSLGSVCCLLADVWKDILQDSLASISPEMIMASILSTIPIEGCQANKTEDSFPGG